MPGEIIISVENLAHIFIKPTLVARKQLIIYIVII